MLRAKKESDKSGYLGIMRGIKGWVHDTMQYWKNMPSDVEIIYTKRYRQFAALKSYIIGVVSIPCSNSTLQPHLLRK